MHMGDVTTRMRDTSSRGLGFSQSQPTLKRKPKGKKEILEVLEHHPTLNRVLYKKQEDLKEQIDGIKKKFKRMSLKEKRGFLK